MERQKVMTVEEFEAFATLPENGDRRLEWIEGEIHEVVSNNLSSGVGMRIAALVGAHIINNDLGIVTGADGGYKVGKGRYIPDFAFISRGKQADHSREAYNSIPPDLVIEVISPSNSKKEIDKKTKHYLAVGATVWAVNPIDESIRVDVPGQATRLLGLDDVLDGGAVLPGFAVSVRKIFGKA